MFAFLIKWLMRFSRCWWLPKGPVRTNFQWRPRTQDISERECELYIDCSIDQVDAWAGGHEASTVVVLRFREVHRLCEIFALMFSFSILHWQKERKEKRVSVEYINIVLESFVDVLLEALLQKERKKNKENSVENIVKTQTLWSERVYDKCCPYIRRCSIEPNGHH